MNNATAHPVAAPLDEATVESVIARHPDPTGDLLNVLEALQDAHPERYLPRETLALVAARMRVAASRIFSVVTFYAFFNLEPQGRHSVVVCRGTACHTRGSRQLLRCVRAASGLPEENGESGEGAFTTPDRATTVRTVACFGQCALAPVVSIDEDIHGYMNDVRLRDLVRALGRAEGGGES